MKPFISELPSPNKLYCVRIFGLPTPEGQPQRTTFTLFQQSLEGWEALYELPESYYMEEGTDLIQWGSARNFITFSVCHFKEVLIYDIFYRHVFQTTTPPDLLSYYWDDIHKAWVFRTRTTLTDLKLSYPETPPCLSLPWNNKEIRLWQQKRENALEPCLYQASFSKLGKECLLASSHDFLVKGLEDIEIQENGQTRIKAFDLARSRHLTVECDLNTLGNDNTFKITVDGQVRSLPVNRIRPDVSPIFDIVAESKAWGESGVIEEFVRFVNKLTGNTHFTSHDLVENKLTWNHDGTKVFYNASVGVEPFYEDFDPYFVVWDIANMKCLKRYMGHAINPRWNNDETDVVFDNHLKEEKLSVLLPLPDGIHALYLERQSIYQAYRISITNTSRTHTYVNKLRFYVPDESAIKQVGDIVCFYGSTGHYEPSFVVRFDMNDLSTKELTLFVWNLHFKPKHFTWDSSMQSWLPIKDGEVIRSAHFYYDDLYTDTVPVHQP